MIELGGKPGELRFTIEIKRAETGKVETYELIGRIGEDGSNSLGGSATSGD